MRRDDICLYLGPADRVQLQALLTDRNTARKIVWRAEIVLATADGCGTNEIMRRANTSKPTVWRWQARYFDEGGQDRDRRCRAACGTRLQPGSCGGLGGCAEEGLVIFPDQAVRIVIATKPSLMHARMHCRAAGGLPQRP
jgi:hypothetical protein